MLEQLLSNIGYLEVFIGMLLESTVIPVPSEIFVPPAAYQAAAGVLDVWLVIFFATLGADCGAVINYVAAYYLGRPIIYSFANSRWGKMCLLNQEKIERAERYFDEHRGGAGLPGRPPPPLPSARATGRLPGAQVPSTVLRQLRSYSGHGRTP